MPHTGIESRERDSGFPTIGIEQTQRHLLRHG